jgi:threonine/homoserine/homoserine lactone efflux protein
MDWSKGRKQDGIRMMFGGVVLVGIGITQAIFGWIGESTYFRILYPVICFFVGTFCIWWGYQVVRPKKVDPMIEDSQPSRSLDKS